MNIFLSYQLLFLEVNKINVCRSIRKIDSSGMRNVRRECEGSGEGKKRKVSWVGERDSGRGLRWSVVWVTGI